MNDRIVTDTTFEIWRDIAGFDGYYQVSNKGRIRSWRYGSILRARKPKILSPNARNWIVLRLNQKSYARGVHQLVAETFGQPVDNDRGNEGLPD